MGDDLEAVELFANAKPGEKTLVAVKLLPTEHGDTTGAFPSAHTRRTKVASRAAFRNLN
jgi:hypothetical protein